MRPSEKRPPVTLDLGKAQALVTEAKELLDQQDQAPALLDPDMAQRSHDTAAARSRALLRTADLLEAAGAEVRIAYWQLKGHDDPRKDAP